MIIGRLRDGWDKIPELGGETSSLIFTDRDDCALDYYQKVISSLPIVSEKRTENRPQNTPDESVTQPATGLLLIFPTLFIHYLEVTNAAMRQILDDLNQSIHHAHGLVREASILNISYNVRLQSDLFERRRNAPLFRRFKHDCTRAGLSRASN